MPTGTGQVVRPSAAGQSGLREVLGAVVNRPYPN